MNRCPISYEMCQDQKYAIAGLKLLSPKLLALQDFYYTAKEQRELALTQMSKISIQGIQPKFSTRLNVSEGQFEVVERDGSFIFKPPHYLFAELPQNEDLTMRLAKLMGLEVPTHGLIYNRDSSLTYFIRRFDRLTLGRKRACEDFSQLMQYSRDTKYESSIEKIIPVIEQHCTFPLLEKMKFFRLVLFNFLIGNEDAHLKNFSLIQRDNKVELSPAYDLVNSTIVYCGRHESLNLFRHLLSPDIRVRPRKLARRLLRAPRAHQDSKSCRPNSNFHTDSSIKTNLNMKVFFYKRIIC